MTKSLEDLVDDGLLNLERDGMLTLYEYKGGPQLVNPRHEDLTDRTYSVLTAKGREWAARDKLGEAPGLPP